MSEKVKKIRVKQKDGSMSDYIPLGADASNIDLNNGNDIQSTLGEIDVEKDGSIEYQLKNLKKNPIKFPNFFLGCFFRRTGSDPVLDWYVSLNGAEWSQIPSPCSLSQRDISIAFNKHNNTFYKVRVNNSTSFIISYSKDLVTWTDKTINFTASGLTVWAPDVYIDENGIIYVIFSAKYGEEPDISDSTNPAFDNYLMKCTDYNTLIFDPAYKLKLYDENGTLSSHRNHIDGSLIKIENAFYLTVKNEYSKINEIFSSTDLLTWTLVNSNITDSTLWVEGPQCVVTEHNIYYYADLYSNGSYMMTKIPKSDFPNFDIKTKFVIMESLQGHAHGTVLYIDNDYAKSIISNLPGFTFCNILQTDKRFVKNISFIPEKNDYLYTTGKLPVFPNSLMVFEGGGNRKVNLHFRNLFDLDYAKLAFGASPGMTITIDGVDNRTISTPYMITNTKLINEKEFDYPLVTYWADQPINWLSDIREMITTANNEDFSLTDNITGTITIYRYGHLASLTMNITYTGTASNAWYTIATVPSNWIPVRNTIINNDGNLQGQIFTNGTIQFKALEKDKALFGTTTFMIE